MPQLFSPVVILGVVVRNAGESKLAPSPSVFRIAFCATTKQEVFFPSRRSSFVKILAVQLFHFIVPGMLPEPFCGTFERGPCAISLCNQIQECASSRHRKRRLVHPGFCML